MAVFSCTSYLGVVVDVSGGVYISMTLSFLTSVLSVVAWAVIMDNIFYLIFCELVRRSIARNFVSFNNGTSLFTSFPNMLTLTDEF